MKIKIILADAAQTDADGKVHALGLGWTFVSTPTPPMAVILLVDVEWTEANRKFKLNGELLTADGQVVTAPGPLGPEPVSFVGDFEAGRPPGIPAGSPIRLPLSLDVGPGIPLTPGERYTWSISVDGVTETWQEDFLAQAGPSPNDH